MTGTEKWGEDTDSAGGTRYSQGKPGMHWAMPRMGLWLIARVVEYGAVKYAPVDWAIGQSFSTLVDCAARHWDRVLAYGPWSVDRESGHYHLSHVGWNILALLHFMHERRFDLDDITRWKGVKAGQDPHTEEEVEKLLGSSGLLGGLPTVVASPMEF